MNRNWITRFVRVLLTVVAGAVVLAVVLFTAVVAYNAFDAELSPEAKALLAPPAPAKIDDSNGFVAMLGMRAPRGEDPMAWGRKVAAAYAAQAAPGFAPSPEWEKSVAPGLRASKAADWCRSATRDCLALAKERWNDFAIVLQEPDNEEMLKRYRGVQALPEYAEIGIGAHPAAVIPTPEDLRAGAWLANLSVVLNAAAGNLKVAVDELEREIAFHRRLKAQSRSMIGALNANSLLAEDLLLASDLVHRHGAQLGELRARLAAVAAAPFPDGALVAATRAELQASLVAFERALNGGFGDWLKAVSGDASPVLRWTLPLLARRNETLNLMASLAGLEISAAEAPAARYEASVAARESARGALLERPWYAELRNPVGKGMAETYGFGVLPYVARHNDVVALARMLALQIGASERGITDPAAIATFVAVESDKTLREPYSGKPFAFDPVTRRLSFEPRGDSRWSEALRKRNGAVAIVL